MKLSVTEQIEALLDDVDREELDAVGEGLYLPPADQSEDHPMDWTEIVTALEGKMERLKEGDFDEEPYDPVTLVWAGHLAVIRKIILCVLKPEEHLLDQLPHPYQRYDTRRAVLAGKERDLVRAKEMLKQLQKEAT